jgi:hypothetical protein
MRISELEADVAYFGARLGLLDDKPSGCYREAQRVTYRHLEKALSEMLESLRGPQRPEGLGEMQVEELGDQFLKRTDGTPGRDGESDEELFPPSRQNP